MIMGLSVVSSVNVSLLQGDKILLSRRVNTGWMDGELCIPGGHVEANETPRQAAIRELKEELRANVNVDDLEFVCIAARNTKPNQYVAYEFVIRDKDVQFQNAEPDKCSELIWVDVNNLPDDVISDFREIITQSIAGNEKYLELGF
jgi:8-oxo-dGTP diphosphatase